MARDLTYDYDKMKMNMKIKSLILSILLAAAALFSAAAQNVHGSLRDYFISISTMEPDSIIVRCDRLIEGVQDTAMQANIAGLAFDYFSNAPLMGLENVAVHIADGYFLNKRLKWPVAESYPALYAYAEFNRASLVGKSAPSLSLLDIHGAKVDVEQVCAQYKILYFYESGCATCSRLTPQLTTFLESYNGPANLAFITVYTQEDKEDFRKYAAGHFDGIRNPRVTVMNLWDPDHESNFEYKYGILTTPGLFLIDSDNRIIGRKLDCAALQQLLDAGASFTSGIYDLLDELFTSLPVDTETTADICSAFDTRTSPSPKAWRETFINIYNYLKTTPGHEYADCAQYVARNYILGRDDMWSEHTLLTADEDLKKFSLNAEGEKCSDVTLFNARGKKKKLLSSSGRSRFTVLFFHIDGCGTCLQYSNQLQEVTDKLKKYGAKIVSVSSEPFAVRMADRQQIKDWTHLYNDELTSALHTRFHLDIVPKIYLLDRHKSVIAKDITPQELLTLIEEDHGK